MARGRRAHVVNRTEAGVSGGIVFDAYAGLVALGGLGVLFGVAWLLDHLGHGSEESGRPYDWERDGECDNASRPRVLA